MNEVCGARRRIGVTVNATAIQKQQNKGQM